MRSATLGVSPRPDGEQVRQRNLATGKGYPSSGEKDELVAALKEKIPGADQRACRTAQERQAVDRRAAAVEERAAKLEAYLAAAGIHLLEDT